MCRVLIADDEPKVLLLIKNLIEWNVLGLELVATANDGISALSMIQAHQPDIVITDIRMPGYDGIELIGRAKELNPAIDFIIISGYRHFDYAQKAIRFGVEDYLLKPLKAAEINQTLRKMIEKYRVRDRARQREEKYSARLEKDMRLLQEQLMASLTRPETADWALVESTPAVPAALEQLNLDFGLDFKSGCFQAIVVKADIHVDSLGANVRKLLLEKTEGAIRDAFHGHCHACLLYPTERGVFGIVNFEEAQKKALRRAMVGIIDDLQSQSEIFDRIKVTVGLGRQSQDIQDMRRSCCEAESAISNRLIHGTGRIIEGPVGDNTDDLVSQIISSDVRKRLLQGVEILDAAAVATSIEGIFQTLVNHPEANGKAILSLVEECSQVLRFGLKSQNAVDDWVEDQCLVMAERLGMCHSQRDAFLLLTNYATSLLEHVVVLKKSETAKPIREAQKYISTHFSQPIGLEAISQRAGFNPTYFSLLFKKETGMNFLEYLTEVRMREAKRVLSDPRKTIADVAEEVGYSDVKHFSKLFTRSTGIHPSKYRKLYY